MKMRNSVAGRLLLLLSLLAGILSVATPIPAKYDGFVYAAGGPGAGGCESSILVDAFLDPLCPDSADSWPSLKQVVEEYSPLITLIVHPFPLPYHNNAFLACRALHIANMLNTSSTFPLLELFFKYQDRYSNAPTENLTRSSIIEDMAKLATSAVGNSLLPQFLSGFKDSKTDSAARTSFKYGCSRGVSGAPFFFVNGFLLPDAGSPLYYETWQSIIEPLLGNRHGQSTSFPAYK